MNIFALTRGLTTYYHDCYYRPPQKSVRSDLTHDILCLPIPAQWTLLTYTVGDVPDGDVEECTFAGTKIQVESPYITFKFSNKIQKQ